MDKYVMCPPESRHVKTHFKITSDLLASIRHDLHRPHQFAYERVGFISAGLTATDNDLLILAREYRPLKDNEYLRDSSVGAMMGPEAIRRALQWAMKFGEAIFHVHTHGGYGLPNFSEIDFTENAKFVPDFFKVAPQSVHGAIVLSHDAARGQLWFSSNDTYKFIQDFYEIGIPIRKWRGV